MSTNPHSHEPKIQHSQKSGGFHTSKVNLERDAQYAHMGVMERYLQTFIHEWFQRIKRKISLNFFISLKWYLSVLKFRFHLNNRACICVFKVNSTYLFALFKKSISKCEPFFFLHLICICSFSCSLNCNCVFFWTAFTKI